MPNYDEGIKHLFSKLEHAKRDRKGELLSRGWRPVQEWLSLEQTVAHLTYRQHALAHNVNRYLHQVARYATSSNQGLLESLVLSGFDPQCQEALESLKECFFIDEISQNIGNLGACLEIGWEQREDEVVGREQIHRFLIKRIINYLGAPSSASIINEGAAGVSFIKSGEDYWSLLEDLDVGETFWSYWPIASAFYCQNFVGTRTNRLYIKKEEAPEVILGATKNACCRVDGDRYVTGSFGKTFPLNSFHTEAQQLTKDAIELLGRNPQNNCKILVKGGSGTCKSQWARSFASEMLSPYGYFTLMIPPTAIGTSIIPYFLPRVCVIVDEFSAQPRNNGSDYIKLVTENFLRIFDDSAFEDVIPEEQDETFKQRIVWIFTSNFERDDNYDPALLRRMNIVRDFTTDINENPVRHHLDTPKEEL